MVKVFIAPGEEVQVHVDGSDGAFAIHYDTPSFPRSLVVKEIAGLPGSHKGKANELLYVEHFGYIKSNPEISRALPDDEEESDDDSDDGSVEYFGEIDDELVAVHDAAAKAIAAIDESASDMDFSTALKLHLQGIVELISGLPIVELDARLQASVEKVQHEKPVRKDFNALLRGALHDDRPPCQERGPRGPNKKNPK